MTESEISHLAAEAQRLARDLAGLNGADAQRRAMQEAGATTEDFGGPLVQLHQDLLLSSEFRKLIYVFTGRIGRILKATEAFPAVLLPSDQQTLIGVIDRAGAAPHARGPDEAAQWREDMLGFLSQFAEGSEVIHRFAWRAGWVQLIPSLLAGALVALYRWEWVWLLVPVTVFIAGVAGLILRFQGAARPVGPYLAPGRDAAIWMVRGVASACAAILMVQLIVGAGLGQLVASMFIEPSGLEAVLSLVALGTAYFYGLGLLPLAYFLWRAPVRNALPRASARTEMPIPDLDKN